MLSELEIGEVFVVKRGPDGGVEVASLPKEVEYVLPRVPEALLARKIIVCEGETEEGLCIALDNKWGSEGRPSFAYQGVAAVDGGGGDQPATLAGKLVQLGYTVALFIDSDAKAKASRAQGATLLEWEGGTCTEQRLALDLPQKALREMVALATRSPKSKGLRSVRDSFAAALQIETKILGEEPASWLEEAQAVGVDEARFRTEFGNTAKKKAKAWFKTRAVGEELGALVAGCEAELESTSTGTVLRDLGSFAHDD